METGFTRRRTGRPWTEEITLVPEGLRLVIRPIEAADAEPLRASFRHLTPEDIRFRFLHMLSELSPETARRLTAIDHRREFALVVAEPDPPGRAAIGAVARAAITPGQHEAEFSIIVGRPLRGHGLASYLVRKTIEWSRKKRLAAICGDVLADNSTMLELTRRLGFEHDTKSGEPEVTRVRLELGKQ